MGCSQLGDTGGVVTVSTGASMAASTVSVVGTVVSAVVSAVSPAVGLRSVETVVADPSGVATPGIGMANPKILLLVSGERSVVFPPDTSWF